MSISSTSSTEPGWVIRAFACAIDMAGQPGGQTASDMRRGLRELDALLPVLADFIAQRIEPPFGLPADHAGVEVDHGACGGRDDGVEDRIATLTVRRPGEGVVLCHVAIVDAADLAGVAIEFTKEGADVDAPARALDERRVAAGVAGGLADQPFGRLRVAAALHQVGGELTPGA